MTILPIPDDTGNPAALLYTIADHCFAWLEQHGEDAIGRLTDEQNTLMAYAYLDSQMEEGGFIRLIAGGYGGYIFDNPLPDSLRRWKIKATARVLDAAGRLYAQYGAAIEQMADNGADDRTIRSRFPLFDELDGDYCDAADTDLQTAAAYIRENWNKFAALPD